MCTYTQITDELLNSDSSTTGKFFSVYRGTYRNIPVAVRKVRGVEEWSEEVYKTFYNEVDFIRCVYHVFVRVFTV